MNARRLLVALGVALLLSAGVTFLLNRKLSRRLMNPPKVTTVRYVAAARILSIGEVLTGKDLTMVDWPEKMPLEGAFTAVEQAAGRVVQYPVAARQPVLASHLAQAGSGTGLAVCIPEGMRATSVRTDDVVGVAGFVVPGSHVDVLVTVRGEAVEASATQIVLQDVPVVTVDQRLTPEPGLKPEKASVVTLLLKPDEAQKLVLASAQGSIHFVLRNGADHGRAATVPVKMSAILGTAQSGGTGTRHASAGNKTSYEVETILGDKHGTTQFE